MLQFCFLKKKKIKKFQLLTLDFISNLSLNKLKLSYKVYGKELLEVYSPLIRNHKNWYINDYFIFSRKLDLNMEKNHYYDGFSGSVRKIKDTFIIS